MYIAVNRDHLDELVTSIDDNINFISDIVNLFIHDEEVISFVEEKIGKLYYLSSRLYDRELISLKQRAAIYYKNWLSLKDTDKDAAGAFYKKYENLKHEIDSIMFDPPF